MITCAENDVGISFISHCPTEDSSLVIEYMVQPCQPIGVPMPNALFNALMLVTPVPPLDTGNVPEVICEALWL